MLKDTPAYFGFSAPDLEVMTKFYGEVLGLPVVRQSEGIEITLKNNAPIFVYQSDDYTAPECTLIYFTVEDIDAVIDELAQKGLVMEQYDLPMMKTDEKGVVRNDGTHSGPKAIAWFKDPADHILSLIQK